MGLGGGAEGMVGRRVCGSRALFNVCVYQRNGKSALLRWTVFEGKGRARWWNVLLGRKRGGKGGGRGSFDVGLLVHES
jgi:hypothetical protein